MEQKKYWLTDKEISGIYRRSGGKKSCITILSQLLLINRTEVIQLLNEMGYYLILDYSKNDLDIQFEKIIQSAKKGLSVKKIAKKFNTSEENIIKVLTSHPKYSKFNNFNPEEYLK